MPGRNRSTLQFFGALVVMMAAIVQPDTSAAELFSGDTFGTGVYAGPQSINSASIAGTTPSKTLSVELINVPLLNGLIEARAQADVQFKVGADAVADLNPAPSGNTRVDFQGGAIAYTGLFVSVDTPINLPGVVTLTGSFLANASSNDLAEVSLIIWNSSGQQLAFADLSPVQSSVAAYCLDPSNCFGANKVFVFQGDSWPGGTLNLPFILPLTRSSGVIMDIWVEAGDFVRDDHAVRADFFGTASLSFNPPPGVTVTLATGEVFGAGAAAVPEPGSIVLLASGLAGLAGTAWRRRT